MEPIACSEILCIRQWCTPGEFRPADLSFRCIGARCSQWVPTTHGSPPVENVGTCADNGRRLMIDRSKP